MLVRRSLPLLGNLEMEHGHHLGSVINLLPRKRPGRQVLCFGEAQAFSWPALRRGFCLITLLLLID